MLKLRHLAKSLGSSIPDLLVGGVGQLSTKELLPPALQLFRQQLFPGRHLLVIGQILGHSMATPASC